MKFEIVDFYPYLTNPKLKKSKTNYILGTVHVYWIDQEMDLRGIPCVISRSGGIRYQLPFLLNFCPVSERIVRYPVFCFTNPQKNKELEDFLKKEATPLVEKYLKENPRLDKRLKKPQGMK